MSSDEKKTKAIVSLTSTGAAAGASVAVLAGVAAAPAVLVGSGIGVIVAGISWFVGKDKNN